MFKSLHNTIIPEVIHICYAAKFSQIHNSGKDLQRKFHYLYMWLESICDKQPFNFQTDVATIIKVVSQPRSVSRSNAM